MVIHWHCRPLAPLGCDVLPDSFASDDRGESSMDSAKRNLVIGFVGLVLLLIGVLVFAQFSASKNFDQRWSAEASDAGY